MVVGAFVIGPSQISSFFSQISRQGEVVSHRTDDGQVPIATMQGAENDGDTHPSDAEIDTDGSDQTDHA